MNCFDVYKLCLNKQPYPFKPGEKCDFDSFVFCRWLSGTSSTLQQALYINANYNMPEEMQYYFVQGTTNLKYIKFPKFAKPKRDVKYLMDKYKINYEKACEYDDILKGQI